MEQLLERSVVFLVTVGVGGRRYAHKPLLLRLQRTREGSEKREAGNFEGFP